MWRIEKVLKWEEKKIYYFAESHKRHSAKASLCRVPSFGTRERWLFAVSFRRSTRQNYWLRSREMQDYWLNPVMEDQRAHHRVHPPSSLSLRSSHLSAALSLSLSPPCHPVRRRLQRAGGARVRGGGRGVRALRLAGHRRGAAVLGGPHAGSDGTGPAAR